jgi:hypothetical protein
MQQKLLSYVLHSPFYILLKVGCASAKKWEFRRGENVTGMALRLRQQWDRIRTTKMIVATWVTLRPHLACRSARGRFSSIK